MVYTVEVKATNVDGDEELLEQVYELLRTMPQITGPALSANTRHEVYVRADVEAPTRVDADLVLAQALGHVLEELVTGTRVSYVMPALAGE